MPHLSSRFAALLLPAALLASGVAALARPAAARPVAAESSPFLGLWELDLTRMPDSYGPPPRRVTFSFRDVGDGQWRTEIDITAPDGSVRHSAIQYRRDGKMVPGEGDTGEADSAAFGAPAPNVLVMGLAKNRMLGAVRVYTVSADGREMTESATNVDDKGAPFVRTFHFRRIR